MTLPFLTDNPAPALVTPPKRCKRHKWVVIGYTDGLHPGDREPVYGCSRCPAERDEARVRRGKTSRNRGNAFEREVAAKLGGRRVGQFGSSVDVEVPDYAWVQCKNGTAYPERIDGWLRAIPARAGILRAVALGDAPGPGHPRRSLIVFDLDEFRQYHGRG